MGDRDLVPKTYYLEEMSSQFICYEFLDLYFAGNISEHFLPCCHIDDQH